MSIFSKLFFTLLGSSVLAWLRDFVSRVTGDGGTLSDQGHTKEVYTDTNDYNPTLIQSCDSGKATVAYSLFAFDDVDDFELRVVADGGTNESTRQNALVAQHLWRNDLHNNASLVVPCASHKASRLYAYQPTVEPDTTLLDYYTGSAAAYSLRSLSASTTNVVKVRRDSDDAELDFTATEVSDGTLAAWVNTDVQVMTNPDIASATGWVLSPYTTYNASTEAFDLLNENGLTVRQGKAIAGLTYDITVVVDSVSFGGITVYVGGTQSAVISSAGTYNFTITAGSSNTFLGINPAGTVSCSISSFYATQTISNGFVTTWYDQSGNTNNATQATAANQPKIVSSGSLVTENGKAAVDFDGSNDVLKSSDSSANGEDQPISVFITSAIDTNNVYRSVFAYYNTSSASDLYNIDFDNSGRIKLVIRDSLLTLKQVISSASFYSAQQYLRSFISSGTLLNDYLNSTQGITNGDIDVGSISINGSSIGGRAYASSVDQYFSGTIQEIIIYPSDQSSNRTGIEANINDYYNIYS